jgi:hypothetical protein
LGNQLRREENKEYGENIGNSDVPEFSPSTPSFLSLFIIREPSKGTVHVVELRNEVFLTDVCLEHADNIVSLVLSFVAFHSDVSKLTDMRTSNRPVGRPVFRYFTPLGPRKFCGPPLFVHIQLCVSKKT